MAETRAYFEPPAHGELIESASMMIRKDTPAPPMVEIDSGPVYELVLSLLVFGYEADGYSFHVGSQWFASVRARASPQLLAALDELAPRCWLWHRVLILLCQMRTEGQAAQCRRFIERLGAMDPMRLLESLLGSGTGSITSTTVRLAVSGNKRARRKLGKLLFPEEPSEDPVLEQLLAMPAQRLQQLLVRILDRWYLELFREQEREVAVRLANEARTKRVIGSSAPTRLLKAAATGLHYLPRRTITQVLLIPSIICRPCLITIRFGSTRAFFYPMGDDPPEDDDPSTRLVKMHRALADPVRLSIIRTLMRREGTIDSLCRDLGQPMATVGAQLVVLRDAGLVTLRMDERRCVFQVRPNLASIVFRTLQAYLPGGTASAGKRHQQ